MLISLDSSLSDSVAQNSKRFLLFDLSRFLVRDGSPVPEDVAITLLKALMPMAAQALSATEGIGAIAMNSEDLIV